MQLPCLSIMIATWELYFPFIGMSLEDRSDILHYLLESNYAPEDALMSMCVVTYSLPPNIPSEPMNALQTGTRTQTMT